MPDLILMILIFDIIVLIDDFGTKKNKNSNCEGILWDS